MYICISCISIAISMFFSANKSYCFWTLSVMGMSFTTCFCLCCHANVTPHNTQYTYSLFYLLYSFLFVPSSRSHNQHLPKRYSQSLLITDIVRVELPGGNWDAIFYRYKNGDWASLGNIPQGKRWRSAAKQSKSDTRECCEYQHLCFWRQKSFGPQVFCE